MPAPLPALRPGDPVPWFTARTASVDSFHFSSIAGRYVLLLFYGSASTEPAHQALELVRAHRRLFDDAKVCFFGVSFDPADRGKACTREAVPGLRFFQDHDFAIARLYGAVGRPAAGQDDGTLLYRPFWLLLDPMLRVIDIAPLTEGPAMMRRVEALPAVPAHAGPELHAPVLLLPRVFEPEFCAALIAAYEADGGSESGFMREVDGMTIGVHDPRHKRRRDFTLNDPELREGARKRIEARLVPEIRKAFQFSATRLERYLVACYDSAVGGHFRAHRDNTTKGTAHRRFAVTINLNAEDFTGGDLRFPEFGPRSYRAPTGGAVVFSCSLLHEAMPVRSGRRYAFLPFLYDEAGARLREENRKYLAS